MEINLIISILIVIAILVCIFLICRELICWYWKINKLVELQKEQVKFQAESVQLLKELLISQKSNNFSAQTASEKRQYNISFEEWQKNNIGKTLNDYYFAMKNKG